MNKRLLSLFLVLCVVCALVPVSVFASNIVWCGTCGDDLYWELDSEGTLTISGTGTMNNYSSSSNVPWYNNRIFIKNVVISIGVTSIGRYAFYSCTNLTKVTMSDSVTSIGSSAFEGCSSLTNIVIPDSVTSIGNHAFYNCCNLMKVIMPNNVTSIESSTFGGCSLLMSIAIPDSVTSIGSCAFYKCKTLKSVTIPASVLSIGSSAFEDCYNLTSLYYNGDVSDWLGISFSDMNSNPCYFGAQLYFYDELVTNIVIPDSITSVGDYALFYCRSLTSVVIPDSVTSIGSSAFQGCSCLTSVVIPDSVTSIGSRAFEGCTDLTCVVIPDSVTSIESKTFYYSFKLTNVVIPDGVTSIGEQAFYCSGLKSVVIPDSVTSIGSRAFEGCSSLNDVFFCGSQKQWSEISIGNSSFPTQIRIHYNFDNIDTHGVYINTVEPTCITVGYDIFSCSCASCNYWANYTKALGHDYDEDGICTRCAKTQDGEQAYFRHLGNKFSFSKTVYSEIKAPMWRSSDESIISIGEAKQSTVIIGNSFTGTYGVAVTAVKKGKATLSLYDDSSGMVICSFLIKVTDHNFISENVVEPTCTEQGYTTYICECGVSYFADYTEAAGHSYTAVVTDSTCTTRGYTTHTCTTCGHSYKDSYTDKLPHDYTTTVTAPTTKKMGYTTYTCTECGDSYKADYTLAAPTISITRSSGKPKISWKAVTGATKYYIYRSTDGKTYSYLTSTTKTSYTNTGAASGKKYYYKVKAVKVVNGTAVGSAYSNVKSLFTTLAAPTVSITRSSGHPKISWKAVTGATKYNIYRSTDGGKTYKYLTYTTKLSYTNTKATAGKTYYYKVKAVTSATSAATSAYSKAVYIKAK